MCVAKKLTQTFVVLEGAVQVMVHRTRFVIAPGGMFLVPKGNTYYIKNVSHREARIFFAQARYMPAPMTDVVHDGAAVLAHGPRHVDVSEVADDAAVQAAAARPVDVRAGADDAAVQADAAAMQAAAARAAPASPAPPAGRARSATPPSPSSSESMYSESGSDDVDASSDYDVSRASRRSGRAW